MININYNYCMVSQARRDKKLKVHDNIFYHSVIFFTKKKVYQRQPEFICCNFYLPDAAGNKIGMGDALKVFFKKKTKENYNIYDQEIGTIGNKQWAPFDKYLIYVSNNNDIKRPNQYKIALWSHQKKNCKQHYKLNLVWMQNHCVHSCTTFIFSLTNRSPETGMRKI